MKLKLTAFGRLILLFSCKTYTVSPEDFKKQLTTNAAGTLKTNTINNPLQPNGVIQYQANNLQKIAVVDKAGAPFSLENSPSIEMRTTLKNGKKNIFYLDTVILENDTLKGEKSRLLGLRNAVPFDQIVKIEVQDGGKDYYSKQDFKKKALIEKRNALPTPSSEGILKTFEFPLDSAIVRGTIYKNFYYAKATFPISGSELSILFYTNNQAVELFVTQEYSPKEASHRQQTYFYYDDNNKLAYIEQYIVQSDTTKSASLAAVSQPKTFHFNKKMTNRFINKFALTLYDKLNTPEYSNSF